MKLQTYVALLRGINVGGNNIIKMTALKECFEAMRFTNVRTYIQSGNVLFCAPKQSDAVLVKKIETALAKTFNYTATVVVVSDHDLVQIIKDAPKGFGSEPAKYRYNVLFLMPPLTGAKAIKQIAVKEGVDEVHAGKKVLYFSNLMKKATQSKLRLLISSPIYKSVTIRNWNTTTKLHLLASSQQ